MYCKWMDCMLGELYPSDAVSHTHTHTHTHTQSTQGIPRSLLATGAPSRFCSLHWLCSEGSEDRHAQACAGQAPASGWPPLLFQGPQNSVPSLLCGENTEERTVEVVGKGQSNSSALEASSL